MSMQKSSRLASIIIISYTPMRSKQQIRKRIEARAIPITNPNIIPTFDIFPSTADYKDENILLGLTIKPYGFGEHASADQVPQVCFGIKGVIRCQLCKAYMNPYNPIQTSRSSYYCALCGWLNPLPVHYYCQQDNVELSNVTYDIVPFQNEFTSSKVSQPHIVLLVQANYEFLKSQAYQMLLSAVEYSLELMQPQQNVLLITYDAKYVSTYDFRGEGTRYLLSLDEKPIRESLDREVKDIKQNLMKILRTLPELYSTPEFQKKNILSRRGMEYAIQCLHKIGGKIMHFSQSCIPSIGLINRPKAQEEGFYSSNSYYYQKIARICNQQSISYSMFLFSNVESNVIEVSDLCLLTRGSFKLYRTHDPVEDFYYDLIENLTQQTAFSATSRLRYSCNPVESGTQTTLSQQWSMSSNLKSNNQLLPYSSLSPDCFTVFTVILNTNIVDKYLVLQNSCLYMRPDGKIRLRISNCAIPLSGALAEVHHNVNYQGLSTYFLRNEVELLIKNRGVAKTLEERVVSFCKCIIHYKKYGWAQDVIFLCLGLLKNKIGVKLKGMMFTKKRLQEMWVNIAGLVDFNSSQLLTYFTPQLFKIQDYLQPGTLPSLLALSNQSIQPGNVYVMLCGKTIIVYYSDSYAGAKLYSQQTNNPISALIEQLLSLNNYRHYKIKEAFHDQPAEEAYQDFMNYLLYSEGLYELRCTYEQFLQLFL